ncbi:MAG: leucine-rich repeat domain-containing protein, partial [Clostridia bacterium]|nr:leucine-rich repeat domain-containing protein [Clostridia bacterium]
ATRVFMADSVTEIGAYSFHSSKSLTSIDLSVNAETVGNYAFAGCSLLDNVVLPSKFSSSATGVFQSCSSLKNLTIEEGVKYIGNDYFYGCSSLEELTLPASLVKAGRTRSAFIGCTSLKKVIFLSATTEIPEADPKYFPTTIVIHGYMGSKAEAFAKVNGNTFVNLPEPDKYTGTCGDNLTWGLTASGLLTIRGEGAMADYTKEGSPLAPWIAYKDILIAVVIEDGVTTIGKYAFNGCGSLQTVVMSDSVTAIMDGAFRECKKLSSINLSKNLTEINQYAFVGAYALDNVVIPGTVTTTGTGSFQNCKGLKNITIENGVTVLANDFFLGCVALEEVKLPASLTKLGVARGVFSGCTALKKVSFLSATTTINGGADAIPSGVEIHGYEESTAKAYATEYGHTFVELPEPLIDEGTCGANVKWELTAGGVLTISGTGDMDDYTKAGAENEKLAPWIKYNSQIKEIVIADGVTNVGARAFAATAVTKVTMADSVTAIKGYAFNNCTKLNTITFSKNLSTIGEYAFLK